MNQTQLNGFDYGCIADFLTENAFEFYAFIQNILRQYDDSTNGEIEGDRIIDQLLLQTDRSVKPPCDK